MKTSPFGQTDIPAPDKLPKITALFDGVAASYDAMNDFMSAGLHRVWKDFLLGLIDTAATPELLDVAGGTGDIAARFIKNGGKHALVIDPTPEMLAMGAAKHPALPIEWRRGQAENLPLADSCQGLYTISFGLRNVVDIDAALIEAARVLRPGGEFFCLEFCPEPWPALRAPYRFYGDTIIPFLGEKIAHDRAAYEYLVASIRRFPKQDALAAMLAQAGFGAIRFIPLAGGICGIHQAVRL
jgi:demethylmenaquinone methyltransferase / 2-methoxy-6-polyprenyl-1,4-benzoquinol methylase